MPQKGKKSDASPAKQQQPTEATTSTPQKATPAAAASATPKSPVAATASNGSAEKKTPGALSADVQAALDRKLQNRPDPNALKGVGVTQDGATRFVAEKQALQRKLQESQLSRALEARSEQSELVKGGVLNDPEKVAPALQGVAKQLEKNLISNQLNQKLYARAAPEEVAPLIKGGDVAPALRSAKIALQHAITRDHVGHLLEQRPDMNQLLAGGILPKQSNAVAPRLQGVQRKLERNLIENKVAHLLEKRVDPTELKKQGVSEGVAPALQGIQKKLERNLARANLFHALSNRPALGELHQRGIYREVPQQYQPTQRGGQRQQQYQSPEQQYYQQQQEQQYYAQQRAAAASQQRQQPSSSASRSRAFQLTRLLLKVVASLSELGEISLEQKGILKDLIVDQNPSLLQAADNFEQTSDVPAFKRTLLALANRR